MTEISEAREFLAPVLRAYTVKLGTDAERNGVTLQEYLEGWSYADGTPVVMNYALVFAVAQLVEALDADRSR